MTSNPHPYEMGNYIEGKRQDKCKKCGLVRFVEKGEDYTRVVGYELNGVRYENWDEPHCKQVTKII